MADCTPQEIEQIENRILKLRPGMDSAQAERILSLEEFEGRFTVTSYQSGGETCSFYHFRRECNLLLRQASQRRVLTGFELIGETWSEEIKHSFPRNLPPNPNR